LNDILYFAMVIISYTRKELIDLFEKNGFERYRADQVMRWIYKKGVTDFEAMTDLPKEFRKYLKENFKIHTLQFVKSVPSSDAEKFLFRTEDGFLIETVLIRERDHFTLCISSQIGCAVGCTFCATGIDGLQRNLRTEEIIDQLLQVQKISGVKVRNIVFMGMGEPLANYENVRKAIEILTMPWGFDLSKRRVTVSTSGIISQLKRMASDPLMSEVNLAVSINAPSQKKREELMPISKTNQLHHLMEILKKFPLKPYRRITLEYVLIRDVNDSPEDARELVKLIGKYKKRFKVNIIPYNPYPTLPYRRPAPEDIMNFQKVLWDNNISCFIRFSKGQKVFGACGQLRAKFEEVGV